MPVRSYADNRINTSTSLDYIRKEAPFGTPDASVSFPFIRTGFPCFFDTEFQTMTRDVELYQHRSEEIEPV